MLDSPPHLPPGRDRLAARIELLSAQVRAPKKKITKVAPKSGANERSAHLKMLDKAAPRAQLALCVHVLVSVVL